MDRSTSDRDNAPSGKSVHTYTPKSHEDLLRSHLQLDASRNAKMQNELQRLADENKKLRRDLDDSQKDIKDRENEINDLKNKLLEKQKIPSSSPSVRSEPRVFEVDGKPIPIEQIVNHFEGVIQKHHDLLDRKNKQIDDLEDALRNIPKQTTKSVRDADTQLASPEESKEDDFMKELTLIRKEYEQVEHILTERNSKLESLIEDLRRKLEQYANEIGRLRQEKAARGVDPSKSTLSLLKEKEKENDYLKNLINSLKNQPQNVVFPPSTNEELENEIKRIIEDKKNAVKKLSNMIIDLKKTPSSNVEVPTDMTDIEKECKAMIGDLNNMNDKLNRVLQKMKQTPKLAQGDPLNKEDLLRNLNNLKKQCEDEIAALKNQLHSESPSEAPVVLTGVGRMRIDNPGLLKRKHPYFELFDKPVDVPSNVQFYLYPQVNVDQPQGSLPRKIPEPTRVNEPDKYYDPGRSHNLDQTPGSSQKKAPEVTTEPKKQPTKPCEACQDDPVRPSEKSKLNKDTQPPPPTPHAREQSPPKKQKMKVCCVGKGGKGSATSNVPYEKPTNDKPPGKEEIVYIHHPNKNEPKPTKSDHSDKPSKGNQSSKSTKSDQPSDTGSKKPDPTKPEKKLIGNVHPPPRH